MHSRRKGIAAILATMLLNIACIRPQVAGVPPAVDLQQEAHQAGQACIPLLLEFAASGCEYCRLLEVEILNPTLLNDDYDRRVLMRKLVIDRSGKLRDFNGAAVSAGELASRYRIFVTPTLLFVDSQGRELAERMAGVTTLELYGGYLDQAIDRSREKLRDMGHCK